MHLRDILRIKLYSLHSIKFLQAHFYTVFLARDAPIMRCRFSFITSLCNRKFHCAQARKARGDNYPCNGSTHSEFFARKLPIQLSAQKRRFISLSYGRFFCCGSAPSQRSDRIARTNRNTRIPNCRANFLIKTKSICFCRWLAPHQYNIWESERPCELGAHTLCITIEPLFFIGPP